MPIDKKYSLKLLFPFSEIKEFESQYVGNNMPIFFRKSGSISTGINIPPTIDIKLITIPNTASDISLLLNNEFHAIENPIDEAAKTDRKSVV